MMLSCELSWSRCLHHREDQDVLELLNEDKIIWIKSISNWRELRHLILHSRIKEVKIFEKVRKDPPRSTQFIMDVLSPILDAQTFVLDWLFSVNWQKWPQCVNPRCVRKKNSSRSIYS